MKRLLFFMIMVVQLFSATQYVTNDSGRKIALYDNGTWEYIDSAKSSKDEIVYVTNTGKKYHSGSCRYLKSSKNPMNLSKASTLYSPCSACSPPRVTTQNTAPKIQKEAEKSVTVYITKTGSKYHRASCSYLRKSAIPKDLNNAKKYYGACSRCNPPR